MVNETFALANHDPAETLGGSKQTLSDYCSAFHQDGHPMKPTAPKTVPSCFASLLFVQCPACPVHLH